MIPQPFFHVPFTKSGITFYKLGAAQTDAQPAGHRGKSQLTQFFASIQ
jgi:hypothetical protein